MGILDPQERKFDIRSDNAELEGEGPKRSVSTRRVRLWKVMGAILS